MFQATDLSFHGIPSPNSIVYPLLSKKWRKLKSKLTRHCMYSSSALPNHVLMFEFVRSQLSRSFPVLPNDCWNSCNPHGNALSSSPPLNSAAVQRSGAQGKAISSKDVPEQLLMPSNIFQLSSSQHCHNIYVSFSVKPTYHSQEKMKETPPPRLGSSLGNKPAKGKNETLFKEICPVLGQKRSSFCLFLFAAT